MSRKSDAENLLKEIATRHAIHLEQLKTSYANEFDSFLVKMQKDIIAALSKVDDVTSLKGRKLTALLKTIDGVMKEGFGQYQKVWRKHIAELSAYEAKFTVKALGQAVIADLALPTATQLATAAFSAPLSVKGIDGGSLLEPFYRNWTGKTFQRVEGAVRLAAAQGESLPQVMRRLRGTKAAGYKDGLFYATKRDVASMSRTAMAHVAAQAREATWAANDDIVEGVSWVSALDSKTTTECRSLDGQVFAMGEGPRPPLHINCLTEDALISSSPAITGVSKRWFDGEVIDIETAAGRKLTCTPNHPILTRAGWVAACDLDEGNEIVSDGFVKGEAGVNAKNDQAVPTIGNVAEAFLACSQVVSVPVPVTAPDFHGDGAGSEVAIVGADRRLLGERNAHCSKHLGKVGFIFGRKVGLDNTASPFRCLYEGVLGFLRTAPSLISRLGQSFSFLWACKRHSGKLLFGSVSPLNPVVAEYALNGEGINAVSFSNPTDSYAAFVKRNSFRDIDLGVGNVRFRSYVDASAPEPTEYSIEAGTDCLADLLGIHPASIEFDNVVSINRRVFSGHVYNLETVAGLYCSNGIVTHNCRSVVVPKLSGNLSLLEGGGTRITRGEDGLKKVAAETDYYSWLKTQSAEFQDDVVGPTRGKLLRNGGITPERFRELQLDKQFRPRTLDEMKALEPLAFEKAGI